MKMTPISVVMPVYNAEEYVNVAIESVLQQSFTDFEFIIIDDGSTDKTLSIIKEFSDKRIRLIESSHDYISSLNLALHKSTGKYIARMDSDDIMHIDRLKIQYAIMEKDPNITVVGSWINIFGKDFKIAKAVRTTIGFIDNSLVKLLGGNILFHPTTMIRRSFLKKHKLVYENYFAVEDYKLWFEIAKRGGEFFVESQPLLQNRIHENQVLQKSREKQEESSDLIREEVLEYLISLNPEIITELTSLFETMIRVEKINLISKKEIYTLFYNLFINSKNSLILGV